MHFVGSSVIKLVIFYGALLLLGSNFIVNCGKAITTPLNHSSSAIAKLDLKWNETRTGTTEEGNNDNDKEPVNYNCSTKLCPNNINVCCVGYHCSNEYCREGQAGSKRITISTNLAY